MYDNLVRNFEWIEELISWQETEVHYIRLGEKDIQFKLW